MIERKDIEHLANLSRLALQEDEVLSMKDDIGSILDYVNQINSLNIEDKDIDIPAPWNVMRNDEEVNIGGEYSQDLIKLAPFSEKDAIKVKNVF